MTINEQLIEKFKREELTENLANGILIAVRPDVVLKEQITEEVRTKIVSLFSSREDKLKIDNYNIGDLINWEKEKEHVITTTSAYPKIPVKLIQAFGYDDVLGFFLSMARCGWYSIG